MLYLLVLSWEGIRQFALLVTHSVDGPLGGLCYPHTHPFCMGFMYQKYASIIYDVSCLVHGLNDIWCLFQGLVCVNSAGVGLGRGET